MCVCHDIWWKTPCRVAQVSLLLFSLLQLPARHHPEFHPDLLDGVRGVFLGIAIGALILMARKNGPRPS
jgi:hypothetical protein